MSMCWMGWLRYFFFSFTFYSPLQTQNATACRYGPFDKTAIAEWGWLYSRALIFNVLTLKSRVCSIAFECDRNTGLPRADCARTLRADMEGAMTNRVKLWLRSERAFGLRAVAVATRAPGEPAVKEPPSVPPPGTLDPERDSAVTL